MAKTTKGNEILQKRYTSALKYYDDEITFDDFLNQVSDMGNCAEDLCMIAGDPDDWGYVYYGDDWSSIGDNETGAQFKTRIKKDAEALFGPGLSFCTHEEAWRNG